MLVGFKSLFVKIFWICVLVSLFAFVFLKSYAKTCFQFFLVCDRVSLNKIYEYCVFSFKKFYYFGEIIWKQNLVKIYNCDATYDFNVWDLKTECSCDFLKFWFWSERSMYGGACMVVDADEERTLICKIPSNAVGGRWTIRSSMDPPILTMVAYYLEQKLRSASANYPLRANPFARRKMPCF